MNTPLKSSKDFKVADMFWTSGQQDLLKPDEVWAKEALRLSKSYNNCDTRSSQLDAFYENHDVDNGVKEILLAVKKQLSQIKEDTFNDRLNDPDILNKNLHVKHDCFKNVSSIEIFTRSLILLQCIHHRVVAGKGVEYVMYFNESHSTFLAQSPSHEGPEQDHAYSRWALYNNNSDEIREMTHFWKDVLENDKDELIAAGIIEPFPPKRKSKHNFDRKGMDAIIKMWKLQKGLMRDGEEISYKELYLKPRKFHLDHRISRKDGGSTTEGNCELMRDKNNLSKGGASNEAIFPHQDGFEQEDEPTNRNERIS